MKNLARPNILKVKNYIPGKPVEEVQRELKLKDVMKLASNENCLGPSPKAVAAVKRSLKRINRYPDASCYYLKKKTARFLGVNEENLVFGNGSDEIISLAVRAFVDSGDEVVIATPSFVIYEIVAQIHNAEIKLVPLTKELKYDVDAMGSAVTKRTKMVFIANPNNPTGTYLSKSELNRFLKILPENTILFLDEAYFEFAKFGYRDYPDGINYIDRPGIIVARSFSKAYGLAGLRIGYGVSSAQAIECMEKVREPFNVNLLAQEAAIAALDDRAFLKKSLSHAETEKEYLYGAMRSLKLDYVESATNFIVVNVKRDSRDVFKKLLKRGVIVRDMKAWGLDSCIRVTVGTRKENIRFIKSLKGALS